jgi:hypothetical protein
MDAHSLALPYHHRCSPGLWKLTEMLVDESVQTIPFSIGWGCRTFQNASHIHVIHMRCLSTFNCCGWAHGCILTLLVPQQIFPRFGGVGWNPRWCKCTKQYHLAMVETVETLKLHPHSCHTYMRCLIIFNCCIDIWLHTHAITTTDVSPDLGELAESLGDGSVQTIRLRYGWGCRTFQNAPTFMSYLYDVFEHLQLLYRHMAVNSRNYHHRHFPRFGRVSKKSRWCKCSNHTNSLWLRL